MPDHGHAPGLPQDLLPLLAVHVPNVCVVLGEAKDSGWVGETMELIHSGSDIQDHFV